MVRYECMNGMWSKVRVIPTVLNGHQTHRDSTPSQPRPSQYCHHWPNPPCFVTHARPTKVSRGRRIFPARGTFVCYRSRSFLLRGAYNKYCHRIRPWLPWTKCHMTQAVILVSQMAERHAYVHRLEHLPIACCPGQAV